MDTREAVAEALFPELFYPPGRRLPASVFAQAYLKADAAIAAHLRALADAGYVVVPVEPTEAMLEAGFRARQAFGTAEIIEGFEADIYRAMRAAAP